MSDPLDGLRGIDPGLDPPSADSIKARAQKIQRRRATTWAASAGAASLIAISAFSLLFLRDSPPRNIAIQERRGGESAEQVAPGAEVAGEAQAGRVGAPATREGEMFVEKPQPAETTGRTSSTTSGTSAGGTGAADESQSLRVDLELSSTTVTFGQPVTMKLKVCNDSANSIEVEFNTSQRYDFEVVDPRTGNVVWRWSADKAFAQVVGEETYAPGCKIVGEESWNGVNQQGQPLAPGRYDAVGILSSNPPKRSQAKAICVTSCN